MKWSAEAVDAAIAAAILVAVSGGMHFLFATTFVPGLDEGIYLEGGQKLLAGQMPYRDFFAFTGPLVYLLQAALESVFGAKLSAARWSVSASLGLTAAASFVLVRRFCSREVAAGAAFVQMLPHLFFFQRYAVTHRWLSMGLMTASAALLLYSPLPSRRLVFAGGALAAAAAWATPSFAAPIVFCTAWLAWRERNKLPPWLAGIALTSIPLTLWLAMEGALTPMLDNLLWASSRYARANAVPYGFLPQANITFRDWPFLASAILIPALLLAAAYLIAARKQVDILPLSLLAFAFALTAYPRWDVLQLNYVLPLFLALGAILAQRLLPPLPRQALFAALLMLLTYRVMKKVAQLDRLQSFETRVGRQYGQERDVLAMEQLEAWVPRGATAFVFPYLPLAGYLLQTRNPSGYSYLQPGMMSDADEAKALAQLEANPPDFFLQQFLPEQQILDIWPNSDRAKLRFPRLEAFRDARYAKLGQAFGGQFLLDVYRLKR